MSAFMHTTSSTGKDEDFHVVVQYDFNNLFKDKNRLKVIIWITNSSYITMGAESWFALTSRVAGEWGKAMREAGHPMLENDPCIPASID
jgi:hypothetical protein